MGLLVLNLARKYKSLGYDINKQRIVDLRKGKDIFGEFKKKELTKQNLDLTFNVKKIKECQCLYCYSSNSSFDNKNSRFKAFKGCLYKLSKIIKAR